MTSTSARSRMNTKVMVSMAMLTGIAYIVMLASKLMEIKEREHLDKISDIKGVQKEIGWGSQIRSYVFMPYTLAKDHRTNYEMGNINAVMDGDIDGFINAYLKQESLNSLEKND